MNTSPSTMNSSREVAARREQSPHMSMFVRMMIRAAILRRGRAFSALVAMVVAAAVATAMLNLYVDTQAKLQTEFRNYGANVVVVGKDNQALPGETLTKIESTLGPNTTAVPFSYAVARTKEGQSIVVVGADIAEARRLNRWWKITPSIGVQLIPSDKNWTPPITALVGIRAAAVVSPNRAPFELTFQRRSISLDTGGILQTGAAEDSRIYIDQTAFENWTGLAPTSIEIAVNGSTTDIKNAITQLTQTLPTADVRPIRQILEGEANVLNKTRATLYAASTLIILTAALCVLATLIGWVFDRRRDFAIMKALGASQRLLNGFFAAEAATLGAIGAVVGFTIGIGLAVWIGRVNFHAPVIPRFSVFPYVFFGSILVALVASIAPLTLLRRVQPALILRAE